MKCICARLRCWWYGHEYHLRRHEGPWVLYLCPKCGRYSLVHE